MAEPLHVALVWHMHQPDYREARTGRFLLPWVRRRAAKDYVRMIETATRFAGLRVTMNFVPTLLEQLELYARDDFDDPHRELCLRDASSLNQSDRAFLVDFTRSSDYPRRIEMFTPFYELIARLANSPQGISDEDARDLQVWTQLIWLDPADIDRQPALRALVQRRAGFAEDAKRLVDEHQLARVRDVLPALRAAIASGSVEPMTSPFAHPILPLLIDVESALVAAPGLGLPSAERRFDGRADAVAQIEQGVATFERLCDVRPQGIWPSECAVSPAAASAIAAGGGGWALSDEGVLARTLEASVRGDRDAMSRLYRPYRERSGLRMVFRDSLLSNRIGFDYGSMPAADAVDDLIARLDEIASANAGASPWLVVIALDGENCWDYFADNGREFLERLYARLGATPRLRSTHVGDYLERYPESVQPLDRLWSGSWIDSDFRTWIGEDSQTRAWELLADARRALDDAGGGVAHPRALRQALIAEGSDWFWWFSSRHESGIDSAWDALYRTHLRSVYELIGSAAPAGLDEAILERSQLSEDVAPLRSIHPRGGDDVEWCAAGCARTGDVFGAMQPPQTSVDRIFYGASNDALHLRFGSAPPSFERAELTVTGAEPESVPGATWTTAVPLTGDGDVELSLRLVETGRGATRVPQVGTLRVPRLQHAPAAVIATECAPIAVVGELAAAVRATVDGLLAEGRTVVVILPHHRCLDEHVRSVRLRAMRVEFGVQPRDVRIRQGRLDNGVDVLTIDAPRLFDRTAVYGEPDDVGRYVFFAAAGAQLLDATSLRPGSVHAFEWQTGVTVARLAGPRARRPETVFSSGRPAVHQTAPAELCSAAGLATDGSGVIDLLELGRSSAGTSVSRP